MSERDAYLAGWQARGNYSIEAAATYALAETHWVDWKRAQPTPQPVDAILRGDVARREAVDAAALADTTAFHLALEVGCGHAEQIKIRLAAKPHILAALRRVQPEKEPK